MLDLNILEQLKDVFKNLEGEINLRIKQSHDEKQNELMEMLLALESTSKNIHVVEDKNHSDLPRVVLEYEGQPKGVEFVGIPGGHEFTSLVLSILHTDGKGKLPDEMIIRRIKNLKGPIKLKTYISLSCENCPEVVQALNLMAILHPDFEHSMIDGELVQDELKKTWHSRSSFGIQQ